MSVSYSQVEVRAEGRSLIVRCRVENRSGETWRPEDGFRVGAQLIDPETHLYIEDGPREAPATAVAPGAAADVSLRVELPPGDGSCRVYVSPMREESVWYYTRNWPMLVVDAVAASGRVESVRWSMTTRRALGARIALRAAGRALVFPFATLWRHRALTRSLVRRDILGRYRGSFGGVFWTVLNPLLLMLTYYFVFGIVLRTRFAGDPSRSGFVLYFLAGMIPWLAFSEAAGRAPFVLWEHRTFVKRLVFPLETLPVAITVSGLVTQGFALALFLAFVAAARGTVPLELAWLPALLVPQVLFTLGVGWFLAALGVYVRDLGQISGFLLTLWFFLTPICYPEASLPAAAMGLLAKNPLFVLVRGYRAILLEGHAPALAPLAKLWLVALAVFVLGHAWFYKLRKTFVDVI